MVLLQFSIQQINCVRDKFGNVTEGAADDIQSVFYVWAVEQSVNPATGAVTWALREMGVRGMQAIV